MKIAQVHKHVLQALQKEFTGYWSPEEIDDALDRAQIAELGYLYGSERNFVPGTRVPRVGYGVSEKVNRELHPFIVRKPLKPNDILEALPESDDEFLNIHTEEGSYLILPPDALYLLGAYVRRKPHTSKLEVISEYELAARLGSQIKMPTQSRPVMYAHSMRSLSVKSYVDVDRLSEDLVQQQKEEWPITVLDWHPRVDVEGGLASIVISLGAIMLHKASSGVLYADVLRNGEPMTDSFGDIALRFDPNDLRVKSDRFTLQLDDSVELGDSFSIRIRPSVSNGTKGDVSLLSIMSEETYLSLIAPEIRIGLQGRKAFRTYPEELQFDEGWISYLRVPARPLYVYQIDEVTGEVIHDEQDSQDLEWDKPATMRIISRAVRLLSEQAADQFQQAAAQNQITEG